MITFIPIDRCSYETPREFKVDFRKKEFQTLKRDIARNGLVHPILVREIGNGRYKILDGRYRFEVCKRLGRKVISANIVEMSDADELRTQLMQSQHKMQVSDETLRRAAKKLLETMTKAEVCKVCDLTLHRLNKLLKEKS